jgi:mRNA-degrading endonuclease toxin of MazEF toxin-antitoxin module
MPAPMRFGQIVWAEMADANGIRKLRPAVVVTPDHLITAAGPVDVVAITSRLPQPLPDDFVLLPWHAQGHPRTGLKVKCAAVCSWVGRINPGDIQGVAGLLTGALLMEITSRLRSSAPALPATPTAKDGVTPTGNDTTS